MKATEAREKALSISASRINKEYFNVIQLIDKQVEDGKLNLIYNGVLSDDVVNLLKNDKYTIRCYQSGMNESSTEIKW